MPATANPRVEQYPTQDSAEREVVGKFVDVALRSGDEDVAVAVVPLTVALKHPLSG